MTAQPSAPTALSPRQKAQLIRSLVGHARDDQQLLDEIRAVLAGADIDDLITLRGGAA